MENVSLTISKEIVTPIVNAKIQEALIAAMGGKDELISLVVNKVFTQKVNENGTVSQYSSDNKHSWLDVIVTNQIKGVVKEAMEELIKTKHAAIKAEMIKQMSSKKGIEGYVTTLLDSSAKVHAHYKSKINVSFLEND